MSDVFQKYVFKRFDTKCVGNVISLAVATASLTAGISAGMSVGVSANAQVVQPPAVELAAPPAPSSTVRTAPTASTPVVSGLSEQPRLINACRFSPEQSLYIYEDAARANLIRTLTAPTQGVFLTGIVGTGLAQIKEPVLGWIGTEAVEPCTNPTPSPTPRPSPAPTPRPTPAPTPAPTPTPNTRACYEVRATQLTVRTTADGNSAALGVYGAGSVVLATTNPPREVSGTDGRIWAEIEAPNGNGWISVTGPNGQGDNALRLAGEQCSSGT